MALVPMIAVVDDDKCFREALAELLEVFDFKSKAFEGPEGFLLRTPRAGSTA